MSDWYSDDKAEHTLTESSFFWGNDESKTASGPTLGEILQQGIADGQRKGTKRPLGLRQEAQNDELRAKVDAAFQETGAKPDLGYAAMFVDDINRVHERNQEPIPFLKAGVKSADTDAKPAKATWNDRHRSADMVSCKALNNEIERAALTLYDTGVYLKYLTEELQAEIKNLDWATSHNDPSATRLQEIVASRSADWTKRANRALLETKTSVQQIAAKVQHGGLGEHDRLLASGREQVLFAVEQIRKIQPGTAPVHELEPMENYLKQLDWHWDPGTGQKDRKDAGKNLEAARHVDSHMSMIYHLSLLLDATLEQTRFAQRLTSSKDDSETAKVEMDQAFKMIRQHRADAQAILDTYPEEDRADGIVEQVALVNQELLRLKRMSGRG